MIDKKFDAKLIELEKEYEELGWRLERIEGEIEDLDAEKEGIEDDMDTIESQISNIKKRMQDSVFEGLINQSDDKFTMDFIKASYFTGRGNSSRPLLNLVNITDTELQAVDGYKGITIKNMEIPAELQNKRFEWSIRENFEDNVSKIEGNFIDLKSIIPKKEDAKYTVTDINSDNFYESLNSMPYEKETSREIIKLSYQDFKIACSKELMDDALMVLRGEKFTVYFYSNVSPILLESENMQIIVLPTRLYE